MSRLSWMSKLKRSKKTKQQYTEKTKNIGIIESRQIYVNIENMIRNNIHNENFSKNNTIVRCIPYMEKKLKILGKYISVKFIL